MPQSDFAKFIDVSLTTIKFIETGRLALSENLAEKISKKTGVNFTWLIGNNVDSEMVSISGNPYVANDGSKIVDDEWTVRENKFFMMQLSLIMAESRVFDLFIAAFRNGSYERLHFRLRRFFEALKYEFGQAPDVDDETCNLIFGTPNTPNFERDPKSFEKLAQLKRKFLNAEALRIAKAVPSSKKKTKKPRK